MDKILNIMVAWFVLFAMSGLLLLGLYLIYGVSVTVDKWVILHHKSRDFITLILLVLLAVSLLGAIVLVLSKD